MQFHVSLMPEALASFYVPTYIGCQTSRVTLPGGRKQSTFHRLRFGPVLVEVVIEKDTTSATPDRSDTGG